MTVILYSRHSDIQVLEKARASAELEPGSLFLAAAENWHLLAPKSSKNAFYLKEH